MEINQQPASGIEAAVVSKLMWRVVPFLFLLYIVGYIDRTNVGFAWLQMQKQLGFSDAAYGLGAGMFFLGYLFFQVPSNLALERVGARRWIGILMVIWGIISSSMALVHTPRGFYIFRFLLGAAEAGFFPGVILYLKTWFPASARAHAVALFSTAGPLSAVVGGPVSGLLLGVHIFPRLAGWQLLFIFEGIPAILLGIIVPWYLVDHPHEAKWLKPEWKAWLSDTLQREHEAQRSLSQTNIWSAFANLQVWLLVVVYFGINVSGYGISLWLPTVIRDLSVSSTAIIGLLVAIPYITAAVAMVIMGHHSDRTGERRWHVAGSAFVGAVAMLFAAYSTSVVPMIVAISVAVLAQFSTIGPFWAMSSSLKTGTAAAASIAIINSVGAFGGFFGPVIIGKLKSSAGGFRNGFLVVGAFLALSGVVTLIVRLPKIRLEQDNAR